METIKMLWFSSSIRSWGWTSSVRLTLEMRRCKDILCRCSIQYSDHWLKSATKSSSKNLRFVRFTKNPGDWAQLVGGRTSVTTPIQLPSLEFFLTFLVWSSGRNYKIMVMWWLKPQCQVYSNELVGYVNVQTFYLIRHLSKKIKMPVEYHPTVPIQ